MSTLAHNHDCNARARYPQGQRNDAVMPGGFTGAERSRPLRPANLSEIGSVAVTKVTGLLERAVQLCPRLCRALFFIAVCCCLVGGVRGQETDTSMLSNALPQIAFKRPLVSMSTAMAALNLEREGVNALIDDSALVAFNLSAEFNWKPLTRILAQSLENHQRACRNPALNDFRNVLGIIFPMAPEPRAGIVAKLKVSTIAQRLNVRSDHIYELVKANWVKLVPGDKPRRGPAGSPDLDYVSLTEWLKKRLIR